MLRRSLKRMHGTQRRETTMTHRRRSLGTNPRKLTPESLEQRDLLAGHGFAAFQDFSRAAFAGPAFRGAEFAPMAFGPARFAAFDRFFGALGSDQGASERTVLSTTLTDEETGATAVVTL